LYFGAAVCEEDSATDMFIFQDNYHDYVNHCGQALDKRMGGPRSPQWEFKTSIQILLHPLYWQCCHGSISFSNIWGGTQKL